jgi:carbon-monoxide dehydrogenase large subunit
VVDKAHDLPEGMEPNLEAQVTYDPPNFSWPFGTHLCVVEIDEETGHLDVLTFVAVDDCGNQINPTIVDGQVHGGVIQGLAQALFEEAIFDADGNPLTSTLADYMVPAASDVPPITTGHTITPSPTNPLGVKGIGEAGTIGSAPAVMNAVVDALSHLGVTNVEMPASPLRIWTAIQDAKAGGSGTESVRSGNERDPGGAS